MPRKKKSEIRQQVYDIGDGVTVTISYEAHNRPRMLHDDRVVIIGEHRCSAATQAVGVLQYPAEPETGPSRSEILEFQRQRETPAPRRIFTSEDAARDAGFPAAALSFENLAGIAAAMPTEDSVIE